MFNTQVGYIVDYQNLTNRLKRKRILKKPNIAEAGEQFEALAVRSEAFGDLQTAGLCHRSAAKCAASLGHVRQEANHLVKAARLFMRNEKCLKDDGLISTEEDLIQSLHCYHEALDRLQNEDPVSATSVGLELACKLNESVHKPKAALFEYKKVLHRLQDCPTDKVHCLQHIMLLHINNLEYEDALRSCRDAVEELEKLSPSGHKDSTIRDLQIYRLLLLLIVEPATSQVNKNDAQFLEKFTWIDSADSNGELVDLNSTLATFQLASFSVDLFLLLQSLVMIVQSCDIVNAVIVEASLAELLNPQQCDLLRFLVRRLEGKVH